MQQAIEEILSRLLPGSDFEYGYADVTNLLSSEYRGFNHGISIVRRLDDEIIDEVSEGPTLRYFELYTAVNRELNEKAVAASDLLTKIGIRSVTPNRPKRMRSSTMSITKLCASDSPIR